MSMNAVPRLPRSVAILFLPFLLQETAQFSKVTLELFLLRSGDRRLFLEDLLELLQLARHRLCRESRRVEGQSLLSLDVLLTTPNPRVHVTREFGWGHFPELVFREAGFESFEEEAIPVDSSACPFFRSASFSFLASSSACFCIASMVSGFSFLGNAWEYARMTSIMMFSTPPASSMISPTAVIV